ncbi:M48 family metalloprotease [Hellea balneolensis]|uniref:M48 family metalloprotease n=1 Tax=Hellea balneolensis TaxID=287478 RepID=UPI0004138E9B|nr:M48 family metalloprotease [Hellea balneolensis]
MLNRSLKSLFAIVLAMIVSIMHAAPAFAQSLLRDTEIEETMQDYTTPILRAAGLSPSAVDIYLVNDPSLNAFVTRGQNIFLHSGIILQSDTPNQLKGVIAHEAGHIAGGHIVRSDYGNRSAYGAMLIAAGVGLAAILAGEGSAGALILGGSQQFGAIEALAYSRVNESAADQYAAQYMEATGQSGQGLIDFFDRFRAQEVLSNARRYPYFRGHPLSSDRIDALRERVEESKFTHVKDTNDEQHRLEMAKAKLRGFLEGPQVVFSKYPPDDQSQPARYARSVAHFRAADLRNAIREIDSLIAEEPENPYFHELKAQILYESGQREKAIEPARKALELKPDAPLLEIALAQSFLETSDRNSVNEAIDLLKSALTVEQDNSYAWYTLSRAYGELGQDALAKYAVAEQAYAVGDLQRARSFAQRAQDDLVRGDPQWRRASDIIVVSDAQLAKKRSRRRGPKPLTFNVTAN